MTEHGNTYGDNRKNFLHKVFANRTIVESKIWRERRFLLSPRGSSIPTEFCSYVEKLNKTHKIIRVISS